MSRSTHHQSVEVDCQFQSSTPIYIRRLDLEYRHVWPDGEKEWIWIHASRNGAKKPTARYQTREGEIRYRNAPHETRKIWPVGEKTVQPAEHKDKHGWKIQKRTRTPERMGHTYQETMQSWYFEKRNIKQEKAFFLLSLVCLIACWSAMDRRCTKNWLLSLFIRIVWGGAIRRCSRLALRNLLILRLLKTSA